MNDIDDKYDLYGVLVHAGPTAAYGHYYTYVKNKDNQWIRLNDEVCSLVSEDEVLAEQAYVLFYHRRALQTESLVLKLPTIPLGMPSSSCPTRGIGGCASAPDQRPVRDKITPMDKAICAKSKGIVKNTAPPRTRRQRDHDSSSAAAEVTTDIETPVIRAVIDQALGYIKENTPTEGDEVEIYINT